MKALILSLILTLFGCASGPRRPQPSIDAFNRSGILVRLYGDDRGVRFKIGSVYPGNNCLQIPFKHDGDFLRLGIRHLGMRTVWAPIEIPLSEHYSWRLEINQPNQARYDLNALHPIEKC